MTTQFDVLLNLAKRLGDTFSGVATGGSTSTLIDTSQTKPDGFWTNGTLFIQTGNNASKALIIRNWDYPTTTFTTDTQSGANAASNQYIAITKEYSKQLLLNAVNLALTEIGPVLKKASLTPVAGQREYTLTSGTEDIRRVEVDETPDHFWRVIDSELVFDDGHTPNASSSMEIYYMGAHDILVDDDDVLDPMLPLDLVVKCAVPEAYKLRFRESRGDDKSLAALISDAQNVALQAKWKYLKRSNMPPDSHWASFF
jgi:hypothetical protein